MPSEPAWLAPAFTLPLSLSPQLLATPRPSCLPRAPRETRAAVSLPGSCPLRGSLLSHCSGVELQDS